MRLPPARLLKAAGGLLLILAVLTGLGVAIGAVRMPWMTPAEDASAQSAPAEKSTLAVELVPGKPHAVAVPDDVRKALGIRKEGKDLIAVAMNPVQNRPLVMPGSTALDPARLIRVRVRFTPADVVAVGQSEDRHQPLYAGQAVSRELQSGDAIKNGQLLAVLYSVDVGNKKNDLFDALTQLRLDEEVLKRAEEKSAAVPEVFLLNARRNVEADVNAVNRAENMLKTWNIPEKDIQDVRDAAQRISNGEEKRAVETEKLEQWARVELKAPVDGYLIEQNVALHETVVDNTTNLFQIAQVDPLVVLANVPEDDLPDLQDLKSATKDWIDWKVRTVGSKPIPGVVDDIGYLIDPSQHTAVVKGHIPNPDGALRAGQFVTATVELRPPKNVVEVPLGAVVEDGTQSIVFVQEDPAQAVYTMHRVQVTHRFDRTVYVRSSPIPKEEQLTPDEAAEQMLPKEPLHLGDRILAAGVLELKGAVTDLESQGGSK